MSGNGVDLGAIQQMLMDIVEAQQRQGRQLEQQGRQLAELRAEMNKRFDDVRSEVGSLGQQVTAYHSSVLGHGILITELDARMHRVEDHLNLPPAA